MTTKLAERLNASLKAETLCEEISHHFLVTKNWKVRPYLSGGVFNMVLTKYLKRERNRNKETKL